MIPKVSIELRREVAEAVNRAARPQRGPISNPLLTPMTEDLTQFHLQTAKIAELGITQQAARFSDEDGTSEFLILLRLDLSDPQTSHTGIMNTLDRSEIPTVPLEPERAQEILIDRVSEYLSVRARVFGLGGKMTRVDSRRGGDTILHCKGYFLSTATAFGTSTPAYMQLPAGRYVFGIQEAAGPRFEGVVWTCPTIVDLKLP